MVHIHFLHQWFGLSGLSPRKRLAWHARPIKSPSTRYWSKVATCSGSIPCGQYQYRLILQRPHRPGTKTTIYTLRCIGTKRTNKCTLAWKTSYRVDAQTGLTHMMTYAALQRAWHDPSQHQCTHKKLVFISTQVTEAWTYTTKRKTWMSTSTLPWCPISQRNVIKAAKSQNSGRVN